MGDRRWTENCFYALKDILGVVMSNDDHTIQDLHDTLKPYYKVARKRFVDAVCLQVVDHFLVSGEASQSPLDLLPELHQQHVGLRVKSDRGR